MADGRHLLLWPPYEIG